MLVWPWKWGQGHQKLISSFHHPNNMTVQVWSKPTHWFRRLRVQTRSYVDANAENLTFKVLVWPVKWGQGHQNLITSLFPLPIICLCKFGQNPPIGLGDRVQTRSYADADRIRTKSSMSLHHRFWGHNSLDLSVWLDITMFGVKLYGR